MQDKEFSAILQDEALEPLALVPLTEEEQVNPWARAAHACRSQCCLHTHCNMGIFKILFEGTLRVSCLHVCC